MSTTHRTETAAETARRAELADVLAANLAAETMTAERCETAFLAAFPADTVESYNRTMGRRLDLAIARAVAAGRRASALRNHVVVIDQVTGQFLTMAARAAAQLDSFRFQTVDV